MPRKMRATRSAVMLRESGASSIPETAVLEPMSRGVLDRPVEPGDDINDCERSALLLRLPRLDGATGIAPGGKTARDMGDRLQPHVLRGFCRERRTQPAGAMEDELFVLLEDRLGIGAFGIDPEL